MNFDLKTKTEKTVAIILAIVLIYSGYKYFSPRTAVTIPAPVVVVKKPEIRPMVEYVTQTGSTVAYNAVNLVARVEGYLESITFTDGTFVKKGQPLFVIQPQPYKDQLISAQAKVAAQKADEVYSKSEYDRQKRMYKQNATSLNNVEKWMAKTLEAKSGVEKAEADADSAAITYSYTHIAAPFDGRIGRHLVDVGNLVGNGAATNLATISEIDTLYVYFNLNEIDVIKLREAMRANRFKTQDIEKVPVYISMQNAKGKQFKAKLDFVNTGLNASTGTIELRALLDNKEHVFIPGLFVQVKIAVSKPKKQLTVPNTAVLYDQIGAYLLTVDSTNKVQMKRVVLGSVDQGMQAVVKGLDPQDQVIVEGLQFASPGNQVDPQGGSSIDR